jgi:hypothetical protein
MISIFGASINIYAAVLILFFAIFLIALWRAQKAKKLDWLDMLTRDGTKVSTTKVLQLVGGVVATWIITKVTIQGELTWDLFAIYLAYVASIDGFSKLIMAKYGAEGSDDSKIPYRRPPRYDYGNYNHQQYDRDEADIRPGAAKTRD